MLPGPSQIPSISVLITAGANKLTLRDTVDSALQQKGDVELLIVGGSALEVGTFVGGGGGRVRHVQRSPEVTEAQALESALELASGDFVVIIGSEDALCPSFSLRIQQLANLFNTPDVIVSGMLAFRSPCEDDAEPEGFVDEVAPCSGPTTRVGPFIATPEDRAFLARERFTADEAIRWLPSCTLRRDFLTKLRIDGVLLHSPAPEAYLASIATLQAETVVVDPCANVVVSLGDAAQGSPTGSMWGAAASRLLSPNRGDASAPAPLSRARQRFFWRRGKAKPAAAEAMLRVRQFTGDFAVLAELLEELERREDAVSWPQRLTIDEFELPPAHQVLFSCDLLDEGVFLPAPSVWVEPRSPGGRRALDVLPVGEPWAYGMVIDLASITRDAAWVIVRVGKTKEGFGVGLLEEGGARFAERLYVGATLRPTEVWLPLGRSRPAASLVILNWDKPRKLPLRVTGVIAVTNLHERPIGGSYAKEQAEVQWRELA